MTNNLTIGMAVYDDYDGVYFSIQAIRLFHKEGKHIKFIVVDNNPESKSGIETKKFIEERVGGLYVPYTEKSSTSIRNIIFEKSTTLYTLCMDCHVLIYPGGITSLLEYYKSNPDTIDIIQGPLLHDDLTTIFTHFKPGWRDNMYGIWDNNKEECDKGLPFEIPMQGCGLFTCKTDNWRKFSPRFIGFGGEEWYIQEKFRKNGGKCICIPQLKWCHRFGRPLGVPYPLSMEDRVWNYFVGWSELYGTFDHPMIKDIYENFKDVLLPGRIDQVYSKARRGESNWR